MSLYFLQSEFDRLVVSATQEAAALYQGSTATPFDHWEYCTRGNNFSATESKPGVLTTRYDSGIVEGAKTSTTTRETVHQRRSRSGHEVFSYHSTVGQLELTVPCASGPRDLPLKIEEARLSFMPSVGTRITSISARSVKSILPDLEPRLNTQLNAYRIIEDDKELYSDDKIEDIDVAFRTGTVSPNDQNVYENVLRPQVSSGQSVRKVS
jgi:hypothetical protein